jgi:hypothetical protein
MLHAYRLRYLQGPHAPPTLWEWEQPSIHHLIINAERFHTVVVAQRYFRDWEALHCENTRLWDVYYRVRPLYDHLDTWDQWLAAYRQLLLDRQEMAAEV